VVVDLTEMVALNDYEDIQGWISEMDRYCEAIEAMSD